MASFVRPSSYLLSGRLQLLGHRPTAAAPEPREPKPEGRVPIRDPRQHHRTFKPNLWTLCL